MLIFSGKKLKEWNFERRLFSESKKKFEKDFSDLDYDVKALKFS
jgi:hypothetical protein